MEFSVADILEATRGRLVQGAAEARLTGVSTDSRSVRPQDLFIAIPGERFDGHRFVGAALAAGAGAALVARWPLDESSSESTSEPLVATRPIVQVEDTVAAYGALAAWWRAKMPARVIAISGSNGKTTCKDMTGHLLEALGPTIRSEGSHNNHIGVPETLLRIRPEHAFAVVELGTNHPGELERLAALVLPNVAVITNIGPSHLEAFGSVRGVAAEKAKLLDFRAADHLAVLHADDPWSRRLAARHAGAKTTFGLSADADWRAEAIWAENDRLRFIIAGWPKPFAVPVFGRHQVANCLAALAVASAMGLGLPDAADRFLSFAPPKWRMNFRRIGDLNLIVDCYNANPASMKAAIEDLAHRPVPGRRVAMLADMLELGRGSAAAHRKLGLLIAQAGFDLLCVYGERARLVARAALAYGMSSASVFHTTDRALAAHWLCQRLRRTDTVLVKGSRGMRLEEVAEALEGWGRIHGFPRAELAAPGAALAGGLATSAGG